MNTSDYSYLLPTDKIAIYPLPQRDQSKLLIYKQKQITHADFLSLPDYLPENAFLFFNNTKVIPARLHFKKESGAVIEIFLLNPYKPSPLLSETMGTRENCSWHCTIGNLKKWSSGVTLKKRVKDGVTLMASLLDRTTGLVEFSWDGQETFADIIRLTGETPLPPYIKRKPEISDSERYQTIYSNAEGAVAAPTAGLHFTTEVFKKLLSKNIKHDFLTLHVSAGTFQPIKTEDPANHVMHEEQVIVNRKNLENLLVTPRLITPVGTTSMRTLESLYWFGVKLLQDPHSEFRISQHDPYLINDPPSKEESLNAVARYMDENQFNEIIGETSIYIRPGYTFRVCQGLITNFHQPASTLILLVAAFIGEDWRRIYEEALNKDYRFLSYGDSSLLIP